MSPLDWLPRLRGALLNEQQRQRRSALALAQAMDDTLLTDARLVVMDLETSGLNVQRDQILSIGAVVIKQGSIDMGNQFERTLYRPDHKVNESVLIHGIAPSEIARGMPAEDALLDFMDFAGQSVFLAFHAAFDQRMLTRGLRQDLSYRLQHKFIDIAEMAPMLCPDAAIGRGGLDDWLAYFQITNSQRHNAAADALATAEIALILLSKARAQGIYTLAQLNDRLNYWRRLRQSRRTGM